MTDKQPKLETMAGDTFREAGMLLAVFGWIDGKHGIGFVAVAVVLYVWGIVLAFFGSEP
jgi:hypothetical protein